MRVQRRLAAALVASVVALCAMVATGHADAATLGSLRSARLFAVAMDSKPAIPQILVSDDFSGTGTLAGQSTDTGQIWSTVGGKDTMGGGTVSGDGGADTTSTVQVVGVPGTVSLDVADAGGGGWKAGVVVAASADDKTQLWVVVDSKNNTLSIVTLAAGKKTTLVTVPVTTAIGGGTVSVVRTGATLTATYRGVTATTVLGAADSTLFSPLWNRVGIYTSSGTHVQLDNFKVLA